MIPQVLFDSLFCVGEVDGADGVGETDHACKEGGV